MAFAFSTIGVPGVALVVRAATVTEFPFSRSVLPIVTDEDRAYFGRSRHHDANDTLGYLPGGEFARFGRSYTGEPDVIAAELAQDAAVQAADTVLLTVPNQLGVEYNARLLETIAQHVAPAFGWAPRVEAAGKVMALQGP